MTLTDRELIIQQGQMIKDTYDSVIDLKKDNQEQHREIFNTLKELGKEKVPNKLFYFFVVVFVGILLSFAGYMGIMKEDIIKNKFKIQGIEEKI